MHMNVEHPLALFRFCPRCGGKFCINNEKSSRCEHCGFVYYFNPSAATVAVIINEKEEEVVVLDINDDNTLLVKKDNKTYSLSMGEVSIVV